MLNAKQKDAINKVAANGEVMSDLMGFLHPVFRTAMQDAGMFDVPEKEGLEWIKNLSAKDFTPEELEVILKASMLTIAAVMRITPKQQMLKDAIDICYELTGQNLINDSFYESNIH
jgi:hypothetical protein